MDMKPSRFTEEQIIGILLEHEAGARTADVCRKHGISSATFYKWKGKYGGLEVSDAKRLDRLARSTRDLLNVIAAVAERGAGFKSLKDAWADTTSAHGRLMLTVLGGLAEFERELIRARDGEGRRRAQEPGVRFGRPRQPTPHQAPATLPPPP